MKSMIALMGLALSFNVIAGPEEHAQAQTCYHLVKEENSSSLTENVPTHVCLENLSVDPEQKTITTYSYFSAKLLKNLMLNSLVRQTEDFFSFKSSSLFYNEENDLGDRERLELFIEGNVNYKGEAEVGELNIRVEQVKTKIFVETPYVKNVYKYKAY